MNAPQLLPLHSSTSPKVRQRKGGRQEEAVGIFGGMEERKPPWQCRSAGTEKGMEKGQPLLLSRFPFMSACHPVVREHGARETGTCPAATHRFCFFSSGLSLVFWGQILYLGKCIQMLRFQ